jgi:hypothetical protein
MEEITDHDIDLESTGRRSDPDYNKSNIAEKFHHQYVDEALDHELDCINFEISENKL